jgi:hypothetical protein
MVEVGVKKSKRQIFGDGRSNTETLACYEG